MLFKCAIWLCLPFLFLSKGFSQGKYAVENIDPDLIANANAVIRNYSETVEFKSIDKLIITKHVTITVLNKKADDYLFFHEFYSENSGKLKDIKIYILDENGNEIQKVKNKDIEDVAGYDGFSIITSSRLKLYRHTPASYPVTISYSFTKESENTSWFPRWVPLFDYSLSLEKSAYKIINSSGIEILKKETNLEDFSIRSSDENAYLAENIKAVKKEKYSPAGYKIFPSVLFSPHSFSYEGHKGTIHSWNDVGQWMYKSFLENRKELADIGVKEELKGLISPKDDKRTITKKLYDYVQENTRYVSIQLGEGGYKPMETTDVHNLDYGDCKALSFYMQGLLKLYDIESDYVLVYADVNDKRSLIPDFYSKSQFNHAITCVPMEEDTVWLDCTSNDSPFNFLGRFTDDRKVLLVNGNDSKVAKTPKYDYKLNSQKTEGLITLKTSGDMSAALNITHTGIQCDKIIRLNRKDNEDIEKHIKLHRYKNMNEVVVQNYNYTLIEEDIRAEEKIEMSSKRYAEPAGEYLLIPLNTVQFPIPILKQSTKRMYPIEFRRSVEYASTLDYKVPSGYKIYKEIEPIELESEYGIYKSSITQIDENTVRHERYFRKKEGVFAPDAYNDMKNFFNKIRKVEKGSINIQNKRRP